MPGAADGAPEGVTSTTGWAAGVTVGAASEGVGAGVGVAVGVAGTGFSQLTEAILMVPVTLATLRLSGSTATWTSSAEAAAVVEVVVFLENSTETLPTSGTSTLVGP